MIKRNRSSRFARLHSTVRGVIESLERRVLMAASHEPYVLPQKFLSVRGGTLTHPAAEAPLDIAMRYLSSHSKDLGVGVNDVANPIVTDQYTDADTGVTHIYLQQRAGGLPVDNTSINFNITRSGAVLSLGGAFVSGADKKLAALPAGPAIPRRLSLQALNRLGLQVPADNLIAESSFQEGTEFKVSSVSLDPIRPQLHYVATAKGLALSWQMQVRTPDRQHWYDAHVDALGGALVSTNDWVDHAAYNVLPMPVEAPNDGSRALVSNPADPVASPFGWHDTNGVAGAEFTDTRGNNVSAQEDTDANDTGGFRPDGTANLNFDFPLDLTASPSAYQSAAITNLFYWNNLLHDVHYQYGFNEAAGNFQTLNYSGHGLGADAVQADAQDGSGTNNANFATPPDGQLPRMQMYLFNYTSPGRDGDLDNEIITHEYGHGVSNRLTGGPADANALSATQSRGMGEGWSDWWALTFTQDPTDTKTASYGQGTYVLGQASSGAGIRRFPYSFDMTKDPLTIDNYGTSGTGGGTTRSTEVHNVGEIWCSALWDMSWLLIDKYGYSPTISQGYDPLVSGKNGGNNLALQLVMDGLKLQPANPSFLQARDAILQADQIRTGGANQYQIWTAFARRGMGYSSVDASSSATSVTAAFDIPAGLLNPFVVSQSPANVSLSPISSLDLTFSKAMDPASFDLNLDVSSFTGPAGVNLKSQLTGSSWSNSNQTLHLTFTPQTLNGQYSLTVGPQILAASDGHAMDQNSNGTPGEVADGYTATFRFDALLGQVVSTTPTNGTLASLPLTNIELNFNEAFDPASLSGSDLSVNQGTVTGVSVVDADTAKFTLSGVTAEGTLTLNIAASAITDTAGNPMASYSGSLALDAATVPFITPLVQRGAQGTLVYDGSTSATLGTNDDTDSFTISLDPRQSLTLWVDPAASLRPRVELRDPLDHLIGSASSSGVGLDALLQTVPITTAGIYTISVSSVGAASSGAFALKATLNAALEAENYNGASNDTRATAQDLNDAFFSPAFGSTPVMASVLGKTPAATGNVIYSEGFESGTLGPAWTKYSDTVNGRIQVTNANGAASGSYAMIMDTAVTGNNLNEAIWTVDLTGITVPTLTFSTISLSDELTSLPTDFTGHFQGDGVAISSNGTNWHTIWTGASPTSWTQITVNLATAAAAAGMTLGADFQIKFQQFDNNPVSGGDGRGYDAIAISAPASVDDYYSFSAVAGKPISIGGKLITSSANLSVKLINSAGTVLASGTSTSNFNQAISNYVIPTPGTYYIDVTADDSVDYALTVVQNGTLDLDPNGTLATAQPVGSSEYVVGSLRAGVASSRLYAFDATNLQIREVNPTTGAIIRSFASPVSTSAGPDAGMATTGTSLLVGGSPSQPIYELNLDTGATIRTITNPSIAVSGMAFLNNEIFVLTDAVSSQITVLDYSTGAVKRVITASTSISEALGASSTDLYASSGSSVYRINTTTGAATLWGTTSGSEGLGVLGNELYSSSPSSIYVYDLPTTSLKRTLTGLVNLEAIGADGGDTSDADYYSVSVNAGGAMILQTATPGDGSGEFVNQLDPAIEIYNPSGVLVASNDNGAPDGRNASVFYVAPTGGNYIVRVLPSPASTTQGEYLLSLKSSAMSLTVPANAPETAGQISGTLTLIPTPTADLIVSLASSNSSRLSVPSSITVPAGQSSISVPISVLDNNLLDGLEAINITATATGYAPGTGSVTVHDDETATLTVTLPSNAGEGAGLIGGTITASAAPTRDIVVQLSSSATSRATVPTTVTLLAGQTGVSFNLNVLNNTQIDGTNPVTITAAVDNWTSGNAQINIADDDAQLTVILPSISIWEGQNLAGKVRIGGTLGTNLVVNLLSSDLSELNVPATVTILAGQTEALFSLTLPTDGIKDGAQTVHVSATALGVSDGDATIAVHDADLDHLGFASITSPRTVAVGFPVTANAYNIDNEVIAVYASQATLSASGQAGALPSSPASVNFVAGTWTGNVTVSAVDAAVELNVDNGSGITSTSNTFAMQPGPVTHFRWNTVTTPQIAGIPFVGTVTALDANEFTATGFSGSVTFSGKVGSSTNIPITPTSGAFVSGIWTGNITVQQSTLNMYLHVQDGSAHVGDSNIFNVVQRTLSLTVPADVRENDGSTTGILSVSPAPTTDLVVSLTNSNPTRLGIPATLTIPTGQTSIPLPITIINNGLLDGLAKVDFTASAATYSSGSGSINVHDNESAVLSVSLPSTATEGAGSVTGVISISDPAVTDIAIQLHSSNINRATVPPSVILPAGQTSVNFTLTVPDNTIVDGTNLLSVTASVENWVSGFGSILLTDNDNFLTVTLPANGWEGQTLTGAGRVQIGGTLSQDLVVDLLSSDGTELSVPANVIIPAGQASVTFSLSLLTDALQDGAQNVTVTARAPAGGGGITDGQTTMSVRDANLDHFTFDTISSPKIAATSFSVTSRAMNIDNEVLVLFSGTGMLSAIGQSNSTLPSNTPAITYTAGVGSTSITINAVDPAARVHVESGSAAGESNSFVLDSGPVAGFRWSTISSPQYVNAPIPATITAKDVNGFTVNGFNGTATLSGRAGATTSQTIFNGATSTKSASGGDYTLGWAFTPNADVLLTHVRSYWGSKVSIWTDAGTLLLNQPVSGPVGSWTETALGTPLQLLAGSTYRITAYGGTRYWYNTRPANPSFGTIGRAYEIGGDAFPTSTSYDLWLVDFRGELGNTTPVPVTPNPATFVNGVWSGDLTTQLCGNNISLLVDDGAGHAALSNKFDVLQRVLSLNMPSDVNETGGSYNGILTVDVAPPTDLSVSLSSSSPSRLSVPATVIIPAGQTSTSFTCDLIDNNLLDGLETVSVTAAAVSSETLIKNIKIHDDETATLSVNLPVNVTEGEGTVSGRITVNSAPTRDILVALFSSNPTVSVPLTVTLPAGQTSAVFDMVVNDNTLITGDQLITIGASVENWTPGSSSTMVLENDSYITVTIPASAWEGQNLSGVGLVKLGGTTAVPRVISLFSSDASELTVPLTVTVPANQSSVTFNLSLLADAIKDGAQTVHVSATSPGLTSDDSGDTVVHDADLDRIDINSVTGPKTAGVGFAETAKVYNIDNEQIASYDATGQWSAAGQAGSLSVTPSTVTFTSGVWTGTVAVNAVDPLVVLSFSSGGMTSSTSSFAVEVGPMTGFRWNPIASPPFANVPFGATLYASDANGYLVSSFNGSLNISARNGTVATSKTIISATTADRSANAGTYTFGYSFTPSANIQVTHVRSYFGTKVSIWTENGTLIASQPVSGTPGTWTETPLGTPVQLLAGATYRIGAYTAGQTYYWRTDMSSSTPLGMIVQSMFVAGDAMPITGSTTKYAFVDLRGNVGSPLNNPITPATATLVNGTWTGNVTLAEPMSEVFLRATDAASHVFDSAPFNVYAGAPLVPVLDPASDTGSSNADRVTRLNNSAPDKTLQFTVGGTLAGAKIKLYANGVLIGSALANSGTTIVTTDGMMPLPEGDVTITARQVTGQAESPDSPILSVTVDSTAPTTTLATFDVQTRHAITFDVCESIGAVTGDVIALENLTLSQNVPQAAITVQHADNHYTILFPCLPNGMLPDGNYLLTIPASAILDLAGNSAATDMLLNFFVLGGDANRDRMVDINDLAILSMNWQGSGKVFSQGDFNYDGKVDAADLGILSSHWQQSLPPPPAAARVSQPQAPKRKATRMVGVVP